MAEHLFEEPLILRNRVTMAVDPAETLDRFGGCGKGGVVAMAILPFAWWRRARVARQNGF